MDVDLDCAEAMVLAPTFLPETQMRHGRRSKPASHYWYILTDALPGATRRYKDMDGATLVELRSNGGQTLVPPSVHPSGEQLVWLERPEPARVSGAELTQRVALVAATALVARHWPTNGARHECAMALAGLLARGGFSSDLVCGIVAQAARAAGDEEVADRERAAFDTVRQIERGGKATGGPTLVRLLGEQVVSKVSDWLGFRHTLAPERKDQPAPGVSQRKPSIADALVSLARGSGALFFHTPEMESYASVPVAEHQEVWALRKKAFRLWLTRLYYLATGHAAGAQAVQDALATLEALALYDGRVAHVHVRCAYANGGLYVDLGDSTWDAVEITTSGWRIVKQPPIYFRRPAGMLSLLRPVHGGSLAALRPFVNVGGDEDAWMLIQAWLLGAYHPTGPYPHLALSASAGSAKSTTARILRSLLDPCAIPLRSGVPDEPRELAIVAKNNWVLVFDNLSHLPLWFSDALCALSTGGGSSKRQLHTDDDEVFFQVKRPVILTGVTELVTQPDLIERTILLYPQRPVERQTEKQLLTVFEEAAPRILGALFDAVSVALRRVGEVHLGSLDRMADFEVWVTAAESGLGVTPGAFLAAYQRSLQGANQLAIEAHPVAGAILKLMKSRNGTAWEGMAGELLEVLNRLQPQHPNRGWPTNEIQMGNALNRVAPNLSETGILVERTARGKRGRKIIIRFVGDNRVMNLGPSC